MRTSLHDLEDVYYKLYGLKARKIPGNPTQPGHGLLSLLQSGRHYRCLEADTESMRRNFFPQAVRLLNPKRQTQSQYQ
ncbi:unnamed protein product [Menidia menidia]|uniref:(Atlantic silverside) hypothetical protein n=1 Tax=Menidia menidia TaxID=238744 RepID=A0A8S4B561_9TELE|nr:unnamed protein product [Menidia menidia]